MDRELQRLPVYQSTFGSDGNRNQGLDADVLFLLSAVVDRAVDISKQFETTSRARERAQRANESLPLTAQADAAFLIQLARLGISGVVGGEAGVGKKSGGVPNAKKKQLLRTLKIIAEGVRRADVVKTQMQAQVVDMVA